MKKLMHEVTIHGTNKLRRHDDAMDDGNEVNERTIDEVTTRWHDDGMNEVMAMKAR